MSESSPLQTDRGSTVIETPVVSQVAGMAAQEVEGVHMGGAGSRAVGGLMEGITGGGGAGQTTRGVTVEVGDEYTVHAGRRSAHSSGNLYQISSEEKFEGTSKVWEIKADDTILLSAPGGYVEISKRGVKIRGLKVEVEGNAIDFRSGGPGEGSKCLRAMAKSATPFVR